MRVLVFSGLYPNAAMPQLGLFVQRRAEAIAQAGADVRVVAPVPWAPGFLPSRRWRAWSAVPKGEVLNDLPVTHPRYLHWPGPGMYAQARNLFRAALPHLRALRRELEFDLIDAHYIYPDGVAAVRLAKALGVPCIVTARGSDINLLPTFPRVRKQIEPALGAADAVVGVSAALAERMRNLGARPSALHVVPNGVDRRMFHFGEPGTARARLGVFSDEKMLLSVGNLNELKGHVLVIEAVARLRAKGVRCSYHLIGEGEERPHLQARIRSLGLQEQVVLHGAVPNERLRPWYQAASAFVLASSREGWPNVLNEALACGAPCVATPVGGVPEIVRPGENGLLVERSIESLASGIEAALARSWDRRRLAEDAAQRGWDDVARRLLAIFAQVTGDAPGVATTSPTSRASAAAPAIV
jgi:glycosyltransferase involved in cell wall biosynthesis